MVDLELRERTDAANDTVARASLPLDPWVVEALREEFLEHGAVGLGIDVKAFEIVLKLNAVQVDIQASAFFRVSNLIETYADEKTDEGREK